MPVDRVAWGYFDTSALAKAYVEEPGTSTVIDLLEEYTLLTCVLAPIELASALRRRSAMAEITRRQMRRIAARIQKEREGWTFITLDPRVLARAEQLCRDTSLQTLDALHMASALVFQESSGLPVSFVTADARQRNSASALGLKVLWVE